MKHNDMVNDLETRLLSMSVMHGLDMTVLKEFDYDLESDVHGEMDACGITKDTAYLFEVKHKNTDKSYAKGMYQLCKDKKYINENYDIKNIHCFFVYTDNSKPRGYNVKERTKNVL